MKANVNVVFCSSANFKSKAGKDCNLIHVVEVDRNSKTAKPAQLWADKMPEMVKDLKFGDEIEITVENETLDSPPRFVSLNKVVKASPFDFSGK